MELLYILIGFVLGAFIVLAIATPKIAQLATILEELTPEGTKIDDFLDGALKWLGWFSEFTTPENILKAKELKAAIEEKQQE